MHANASTLIKLLLIVLLTIWVINRDEDKAPKTVVADQVQAVDNAEVPSHIKWSPPI